MSEPEPTRGIRGVERACRCENEVCPLGDSRDHSCLAEVAFTGQTPTTVIEAIAEHPEIPLIELYRY